MWYWNSPVKEKIEKIAKEIYGADGVDFDKKAKLNLKRIERLGADKMKKTVMLERLFFVFLAVVTIGSLLLAHKYFVF